uniref:H15 domain-containing protein n=1 Tax=Amphiprion percula TaxID=161767 RepID=A0A3P8TS83_AMPPE
KAPKKKGSRPTRDGPSLPKLIVDAVAESKERKGISLAAIKKVLASNGLDVVKANKRINTATKGTGASGSFKLAKKEPKVSKPAKKETKKKAPVKAAAKKAVKKTLKKNPKKSAAKKPKPAAKKPKPAVKKPVANKSAAKKPAAKKAALFRATTASSEELLPPSSLHQLLTILIHSFQHLCINLQSHKTNAFLCK